MPPTIAEAWLEARDDMSSLDWPAVARNMIRPLMPEGIQVAFFGEPYWIGPHGCRAVNGGTVSQAAELVLSRYVLRFPAAMPAEGPYTTFRELDGAGPLSQRFADNTHKIIATTFGRTLDGLQKAAQAVNTCRLETQPGFELTFRFQALPHVPLYLRFNAAEEEFPAQAALLFHRSAAVYLDLQALFIVATYLTGRLIAAGRGTSRTGKPDSL